MARVHANMNQARQEAIAINSFVCSSGDAIRITAAGFATTAGVGERIDGIALNNFTFAATNQTVEKQKVDMVIALVMGTWDLPVVNGPLTDADVGQFFEIDASQNLDASTSSTSTGVLVVVHVYPGGLKAEVRLTGQGT